MFKIQSGFTMMRFFQNYFLFCVCWQYSTGLQQESFDSGLDVVDVLRLLFNFPEVFLIMEEYQENNKNVYAMIVLDFVFMLWFRRGLRFSPNTLITHF